MGFFKIAAEVCGSLSAVFALAVLFIKPLRRWALGMHKIEDGQKCLLRSDMLRTYYKHRDDGVIRQYEKENFIYLYNAYKALDGNSFIDDIYNEVRTWDVVS